MVNWGKYLDSILSKYGDLWERYTLTDVLGKKKTPDKTGFRTLFDLMVQTCAPSDKEEDRELERREKTEKFDALAGLRKFAPEHVLLTGRPGSGKTTALLRLLLEETEKAKKDQQVKIPVLVELKYFTDSTIDLVRNFLQRHKLLLEEKEIEKLLFDGRLLLLVDGLNELPSDAARRGLKAFRENFKVSTSMIFTTRELGAGGDLGIEKKLEMLPLTEEQIKEFVKAYLPDKADAFLNKLKDRLRDLGRTPLFLEMLCAVFEGKGEIPQNLGMMFREFTAIYEEVKLDVFVSDESRRLWPELLQCLAFEMMHGEKPTDMRLAIPRQEAVKIFNRYFKDEGLDNYIGSAHTFLDDLIKYHLIQYAEGNKIEFRHQLIQEYYAAEYLLKIFPNLSDDELKRDYLNFLKWTEPIALMLGLVDDLNFAKRVVELAIDIDLQLTARLAGSVKPKYQTQTVTIWYRHNMPMEFIITLMGKTRSELFISMLEELLENRKGNIRKHAAFALGEIGSDKATDNLIEVLTDDDWFVNQRALEALVKIGSDKTIKNLTRALSYGDVYIRGYAAEALGELGSDKAIGSLIKRLRDADWFVRERAARALGEIGSDKAVYSLIRTFSDEHQDVVEAAAEALGEIGSEKVVNKLSRLVRNKNEHWDIKDNAAKVLGKIGNEKAVDSLIKVLNDWEVVSATEALGKIGSEKAVASMIMGLNDCVVSSAAEALGKIGSEKAVDSLIKTLSDSEVSSAAEALGEIGSNKAIKGLTKALSDENVKWSAAKALAKIGSDKAIDLLITGLSDKKRYVKQDAAKVLGEIRSEKAIDDLIKALSDSEVSSSAAEALGEIGSEKAVSSLIDALSDKDWDVRRNAAEALGEIGSEKAVGSLIDALSDKDRDVRRYAAEALGGIGNQEVLSKLKELLTTPSELIYLISGIVISIQNKCGYYDPILLRHPLYQVNILHLSDLHFGTKADAINWFTQIRLDLEIELEISTLDGLIISGDAANRSTNREYSAAKLFIEKLCDQFCIKPDWIAIVPGNHDLNWTISEKAYGLKTEKGKDKKLKGRFKHFREFYEDIKGEPYPEEYDEQGICFHFPLCCLLILGLNSAWQTDHVNKQRAGICQEALSEALNTIQDEYKHCIKFAVWHHPLVSPGEDRIKKHGFLGLLAQAGFSMALHGHIHKSQKSHYPYEDPDTGKRIEIYAAGTLGAEEEELLPAYPWQYNLIKIEGQTVQVVTRRKKEKDGPWSQETVAVPEFKLS